MVKKRGKAMRRPAVKVAKKAPQKIAKQPEPAKRRTTRAKVVQPKVQPSKTPK